MRAGRKKLDLSEKRSRYLNIAFNENELKFIYGIAVKSKVKPSVYIRESAMKSVGKLPVQIPEINQEKWLELGKIGSNLNQIARALNSHEYVEISYIKTVLDNLRASLICLSLYDNQEKEGLNK